MKTFVKIIAILLIVFGSIVTLAGTFTMIDKPNDIATDVLMIVIFGITPILGGVLILRKQKSKTQAIKSEKDNTVSKVNNYFDRVQVKLEEQKRELEKKMDESREAYKRKLDETVNIPKIQSTAVEDNREMQQQPTGEQTDKIEDPTLTIIDIRSSEIAEVFPIKELKRPNFFHQLFKTNPKINAIIEINNLLGTKYLRDIKATDIQEICTRYRINLRGSFLKNVKELYARYLKKCLENYLLTDEDCMNLAHLGQLLVLQEKETAELYNKLASEIYKRIYDEALSGSKLGKYNEEYIDKLKKDIRLTNEIADKISYDCRQNYLLNQFAIIRKDEKISPDGWNEFCEISKNLNISLESDPASNARIERMKLNWLIEYGELPVKQVNINLPASEQCYYSANIDWLETRKVTKRVNYHGPTLRVKIVKGVYYRAGSIAPQRITSDELQVIDSGTVYITNKRIIFTGTMKNTNIPLSKILSITPYSDGVGIEKDSGKSPILRVSNDSDMLAMIIARVIKDS